MPSQLTETVVRIREMILRGDLGSGQRLAEAPLADMLGISRTPVRQALPLLAQEGLLAEHATRGYVVRPFTAADIADAIDLRGTLEGMAARRVAERGISETTLRDLRSCLEDGDAIFRKRRIDENDEALYTEMNERFHLLLLREANSTIITAALERNNRVPFAAPQALAFDTTRLEQMFDLLHYAHRQHHAVVEALERGQGGRVEALMREHAVTVKESINMAELRIGAASLTPRIS